MSHLATLIQRVRNIENDGRNEHDLKEKLLNLAEYITYSNDYDSDEIKEAHDILYEYGMEQLLFNTTAITNFVAQLHGTSPGGLET